MSERLRILIVAYSAAEREGSESAAGFSWIKALSDLADLTVVTRKNNLTQLAALEGKVKLVGFDLPRVLRLLKGRLIPVSLYYYLWMLRLPAYLKRGKLDLSHDYAWHLTFASVNRSSAVFKLDLPVIWGPVGGRTRFRFRLVSQLGLMGALREGARYLLELAGRHGARRRADRSEVVIYQNPETVLTQVSRKYLVRTNIVHHDSSGRDSRMASQFDSSWPDGLRVLFVSRSAGKGERLLEKFISDYKPRVKFTILGSVQKGRWQKFTEEGTVEVKPRLSRAEYVEILGQHDGFASLSVRESAGWAIAEALGAGIPVFAFDINGPAGVAMQGGTTLRGLTLSSPSEHWQPEFERWIRSLGHHRRSRVASLGRNFSDDALKAWIKSEILPLLNPSR